MEYQVREKIKENFTRLLPAGISGELTVLLRVRIYQREFGRIRLMQAIANYRLFFRVTRFHEHLFERNRLGDPNPETL